MAELETFAGVSCHWGGMGDSHPCLDGDRLGGKGMLKMITFLSPPRESFGRADLKVGRME